MKHFTIRSFFRAVPAVFLAGFISGCATIPPASVGTFSTGVTAAKNQTHLALTAAAQMSRSAAVDYAAEQKTLNVDNLQSSPDAEIIASWDRIFSVIENYSQQLAALVSPDVAKDFTDSAVTLAGQFQTTATQLKTANVLTTAPEISPELATAFTEAGGMILRMKAQSDAIKIAAATDPAIHKIFITMAAAIGDSATNNLRGDVRAHWQTLEGPLQVQFLRAADKDAKLKIVQQFAGLLDQQDAQDLSLDSLRRSLLALADAHHALAQGQAADLRTAIGIVSDELSRTQALYDQFSTKAKP